MPWMKWKILLLTLTLIAAGFGVKAQNSKILKVGKYQLCLLDVGVTDALVSGGGMTHTATMRFSLRRASRDDSAIIKVIQSAISGQGLLLTRTVPSMAVLTVGSDGFIQEHRDYVNAIVQAFSMVPLKSYPRDTVIFTLKISSAGMVLRDPGRELSVIPEFHPFSNAFFSATVAALPSSRITSISSINFIPNASGKVEFDVSVSMADADVWIRAFLNGTARSMKGVIYLNQPNLDLPGYAFSFTDASIISYTVPPTSADQLSKAIIRLSAKPPTML